MALVILALLLGIGAVAWQARKALTQAEIAREQTRIAQVEAKTAEAVQAFLEGIFRANTGDQADPRKARQRTAKDLLDEGARRIEHDLNSAPQAKLRVLRVLGLMYEDMIELETSIAMDDRRIETARRAYGPGSSEELHARADRASRLIHVERANEAEAELERARLLLEARADHSIEAQTAYYMHRARYCQYRQDVEGGLGSIDKALGLLRSQPPSVYLVGALEIRAALLNFVQRSEDALAAADEGLALIAAQPGLAESLRSELHLRAAQAHAHLNDYTAAESAFRAAAAAVDAVGGPTSEMAAYVRAWQGRVLLQGSRVRAAGEAARESASIILAGIEQRPYFLAILSEAIAAYRRLGWLADALPLIEYCEAMAPEQAENRLAATNFLVNRAALAIESGDFGDAQASLARARAVIETRGLGTHPVYRDAYVATLVRLHAEQGDGDGALHELRDAYAASGGEPAADDPAAAQTAAIATLAVGDAAATAQLCERALAIIEQDPKRDARAELEAALHLLNGRAHLAGGDARGALEPLRRAEAMHRDLYDPEPAPWLARAKIILGEALRATGDIDGAVTMLQEAKLMHARHDRLGPQYTGPLQSLASALNVGAK
jgi:serine/threonine-protein kinase